MEKLGSQDLGFLKIESAHCPFFTDERHDLRRLRRVIKVTRAAKRELGSLLKTSYRDLQAAARGA